MTLQIRRLERLSRISEPSGGVTKRIDTLLALEAGRIDQTDRAGWLLGITIETASAYGFWRTSATTCPGLPGHGSGAVPEGAPLSRREQAMNDRPISWTCGYAIPPNVSIAVRPGVPPTSKPQPWNPQG